MGLLKILGIGKYLKKVKAYVDSHVSEKIAEVVANAPDDLDTLKEIADYIASDKTGAAEINNTLDAHGKAITELGNQAEELGKTLEEGREAIANLEDNKVDKVDGKGLSTEDYTTADKAKLAGLENYDDSGVKASISSLTEATNENKSAIDALEENKADRDGYYPNLRVGLSDNLPDRGDVLEGVLGFRESAGKGNSTEDGTAEIKELMGESLVWNQIILNSKVVTTLASKAAYTLPTRIASFVVGHYYIAIKTQSFPTNDIYFQTDGNQGVAIVAGSATATIGKYTMAISSPAFIYNNSDEPVDIDGYFTICDLTLMFGSGNEPTTIEEFNSRVNQLVGVDMYAYNEGEVIGVNPTGIKSVNDNAFNGEYARVLGGKEYCIDGSITSIGFTKELGGTTEAITLDLENKYTPSENGYIYASGSDICIHLVHTGYKGHDYVAHDEDTMPLDLTLYFPDGMHGINGVRDSVTKDKATRRIGVVDMGTLNWQIGSTYIYSKAPTDMASDANGLIKNYTVVTTGRTAVDKTMILRPTGDSDFMKNYIGIKDSAYTDAASFKAAMSGVMLYYELAEPIETEIDPQLNLSYRVWDFGTEELLSDKMSCPAIVKALYGFNATDTIRGNKAKNNEQDERLEVLEKEVVRNDDYAPAVTVGFADNLVSNDVVVDSEFSLRQSGDGAILDGSARIEEVQGNSVVWNQQVDNGEVSGTFDKSQSSSISYEYIYPVRYYNASINGHKIYAQAINNGSELVKIYFSDTLQGNIINGRIFTANTTNIAQTPIYIAIPANSVVNYKFTVVFYDLTLMFGAGNEPTTIEEFYARIPQGVDLYAYNEGEVIHSKVDAVKSIGRNVWDEEWENGYINNTTGQNEANGERIRSKNYIPISPDTAYFYKATPADIFIRYYDADKNYIGSSNGSHFSAITSPANARYMRFSVDGPTYNNDICINLSDPDFNGQYEPYREDVRELPSVLKEVFPEGMMSAGSANDVAYNDRNKEVGVTEKRIKKYVFTTCESIQSINDSGIVNILLLGKREEYSTNIVFEKYVQQTDLIANTTTEGYFTALDKEKKCLLALYLRLRESTIGGNTKDAANAYLSANPAVAYMETLRPELAEHELFNLDYEARNGGQEEAITSQISTPLKAKIAYGFNAAAKIKENAQSIAEIESEISGYTLATEADIDSIFTE